MSYNGSGTFLINTAGQPVVSGTVISSTAFNALTADLATGLSTAITKDGQTTVTANIPMSTYKFTGLGVGSAATDSANLSQVQSTVTKLLNSVSGADTITATASPTLAAYAAGQMFYFVAAGDNTTSVTLNIDSLGAKAVTRDGATALAAADIKSGEVVVVVYDGTRFQVVSQLNSAGDARFANVSIASSLYVGGVSTFVGNAGFSANVSIASALSVGGVAAITGATTIGGNLTLSGGTANGVLYLNGSKVATSGSAFAFNGTDLTLPAEGYRASATSFLRLSGGDGVGNGANLLLFGQTHATAPGRVVLTATGTGYLQLATFGGAATLDSSGNLGIGTTSPSGTLGRNITLNGTNAGTNSGIVLQSAGTERGYAYASDTQMVLGSSTSIPLLMLTGGSERMRLTAAGDLGIGTASPRGNLDVSSGGLAGSQTRSIHLGYSAIDFYGFRVTNINDAGSTFAGTFAIQRGTGSAWVDNVTVDDNANVTAGGGTLATTATNGFLYVPTCAGTPTGTPTAKTGYAPIVVNTTNNKLYFYSGGAWRDAGP